MREWRGHPVSMRHQITEAWRALYRAVRPLRRATAIGPLVEAFQLRAVLRRVRGDWWTLRVLGADEFAPYLRELVPLSPFLPPPRELDFDYVIARQDHLTGLDRSFLRTLGGSWHCVYANSRFALFAPGPRAGAPGAVERRIDALVDAGAAAAAAAPRRFIPRAHQDRAILVTTFNRPAALARSLPQLAALGYPMVVVDDGSSGAAADATRQICRDCAADLVALPANRGLVAALNVGLSYVMAGKHAQWIAYFQDDVDVDPRVMDQMRALEDAAARPILTGYDADEHPAERVETINGIAVKLKRSSPAVHLHAHLQYWRSVMPVPPEYVGAPKRRWEASLEDYWIVNHAPGSAGRRGLLVPCVPNLVRTFLWDAADSSWGNPNTPDPPLLRAP